MRIHGTDSHLCFDLLGYEFPHQDWLVAKIEVRSGKRLWRAVDPCLEAGEAASFAGWLESIGFGRPTREDLMFTEDTIWFELVSIAPPMATVRIDGLGGHPAWKDASMDEAVVLLTAPLEEFRNAAVDLRLQCELYPPRDVR